MSRPDVVEHVPSARYLERVREIVAEELELEPGELTDHGHFVEDFDGDSLALITVVARIDRELSVEIPKSELPELTTLAALSAAVLAHAGQGPSDG
ncbi:acyl carrier protein [Thermomonospora echinospora]|uniref:Acyl carrier protein n=2 Tax=Thermomonospora echinospora TaxID=1992 RepID=A0A1H5VF34_9ACTN|nr:acyl carrier protein [Thermomonospora echinospora]